jgi:hypothetical protein
MPKILWNHEMTAHQQTLSIAPEDQDVALRLLSAMILSWDRIPIATQGWIMHDAFVMKNGSPLLSPEALMSFIDAHKGAHASSV